MDAATESSIACANPDCRVSTTGKCVEGLELGSCPDYGHAVGHTPSDDSATDVVEEPHLPIKVLPEPGTSLPSGGTLSVQAARSELGRNSTRVIALIGPNDAGKTSLIAALYDLLQSGPIGSVSFARSWSLQAFEQVCHDARMISRRGTPHSPRTPHGQVRFYHLHLIGNAGADLALLLGDRAGEDYTGVADDVTVAKELPEILGANTLTLLVDGGKLLDTGARHKVRSQVRLILQGLRDGGTLTGGQQLAIVLTKLDRINVSPFRDRAEADFNSLLEQLRGTFSDVFPVIKDFRIAASPQNTQVSRGEGLLELLQFWMSPLPIPHCGSPNTVQSERAFGRFDAIENQAAE